MMTRPYVLLLAAATAVVLPAIAVRGQCAYSVEVFAGPKCPWPFETIPVIDYVSGNDNGLVTGHFGSCGGSVLEHSSFTWTSTDGLVVIQAPKGTIGLRAYDVSNDGTVAGPWDPTDSSEIGFKIEAGAFATVAPGPDSKICEVSDINNNRNEIVGYWNPDGPISPQRFLLSDGRYEIIRPTYGPYLFDASTAAWHSHAARPTSEPAHVPSELVQDMPGRLRLYLESRLYVRLNATMT